MTFKIVLTCLFFAEIAMMSVLINKPREMITHGGWAISSVIYGLLIYGVWHWL